MAERDKLNRKQKRDRRRKIPWTIFAALVYASFYIPVLVMILFSFNDAKRNYSWMGFTTEWYPKLFSFGNHDLWESLVYSLVIAILATVISVIIGVLGGIGLKKFEFRGKRFINMMLFVPIVVPEVVMAVSMLIIFMIVGIKLGLGAIVIGHCTFCIPYAVIIIKGRITTIENVECCGLGGSAMALEPDLADCFAEKLRKENSDVCETDGDMVTYCASCTGRFKRSGFDSIDHIITKVVGTNEKPDTTKSYINRVLTRFK